MWLKLILFVAAAVISYLLRPQVKQENPSIQNMDDPTADAGKPIPVIRGTMLTKSTNLLWYGQKDHLEREVGGGDAKK